jgi:hypothetical protein
LGCTLDIAYDVVRRNDALDSSLLPIACAYQEGIGSNLLAQGNIRSLIANDKGGLWIKAVLYGSLCQQTGLRFAAQTPALRFMRANIDAI